MHLFNRYS